MADICTVLHVRDARLKASIHYAFHLEPTARQPIGRHHSRGPEATSITNHANMANSRGLALEGVQRSTPKASEIGSAHQSLELFTLSLKLTRPGRGNGPGTTRPDYVGRSECATLVQYSCICTGPSLQLLLAYR
jgi:hypothetical protein